MVKMLQYLDGLYVNLDHVRLVKKEPQPFWVKGVEWITCIELDSGSPVWSDKSVEHIVAVINGEEPY